MSYEQFSKKVRSQKVTLAVLRAKQRLKSFIHVSGDTWTRRTKYVVSSVSGAPFTYDLTSSVLTITSSENPNKLNIIVEYSFFFSDFPINQDVEYRSLLQDIGALKLELDTENTGVAIESDSSIKLENVNGFFDNIYDTLIWENQLCEFYSWSPSIPWNQRKLIYRGYVSTKAFNEKVVSFTLKDVFVKLREKIPASGSRLIYGKAKNLNTKSLDPLGEGYELSGLVSGRNDRDLLSGVISGVLGSDTINGTGTSFTTQLLAGDKIRVIDGILEYSYTVNTITNNNVLKISGTISANFAGAQGRNASKLNNIITGASFLSETSPGDKLLIQDNSYTVASVENDGSLKISEQIKTAFTDSVALNKPEISYWKNNRSWNVSGHLLADHSTTVKDVISQSIFTVNDIGHIAKGDSINLASNYYTVDRVSGDLIFLNQVAVSIIVAGASVIKPSIQKVIIDDKALIPGRDFIEENLDNGCKIILSDFAERNIASENVSGVSLVFTVGSREVTALTSTLDLTTILSPRGWIKAFTGTIIYYEILSVEPTKLTLRVPYSEPRPFTGPALYKTPIYVGDSSSVLVDCMGKRSESGESGRWLKTASDAVKDICTLIGVSNLNEERFQEASADADYTLCLVYPKLINGEMPIARDAILEINKSVFGSLYSDNDFNIAYSVLNADRDENIELIKDEDIISFTTSTKNQIVGTVKVNYRAELGKNSFSTYSFSNDNISGLKTELSLDLCLYDDQSAINMAQRYAFFRSQSQTTVTIKAKLNLIYKTLNDRVYLKLGRLFQRFGSAGSIKVGLVNMISKDSSGVDIQINDLGNVFSRVGAISPDNVIAYSSSTEEEVSKYGYIVDNDSETVDTNSDVSLGTNLIG